MTLNSIQAYNKLQRVRYAAKTGFDVDISKLGKNTQTIARELKSTLEEVREGVWLNSHTISFKDGNFTNVYDLFWNSKKAELTPHVHSAKRPFYLFDYIRKNRNVFAVINGSFFFLIDNKDREPKDFPFHFCVRDGKIMGLLSSNEPVLYTRDGKMFAEELQAKGTMKIGSNTVSWVGIGNKKTKKSTSTPVLYNSGDIRILKMFNKVTGIRDGFLDKTHVHTEKNVEKMDLVINADAKGTLQISKIHENGNTHYFEGLFIIQLPKSNEYNVGDIVTPLTLDTLSLSGISTAITINKSVHDKYFYTPDRVDSRDARSVIAQDLTGNTHFVVFDGSKYIPRFKGVSAKDIAEYFSKDKFKWAYFLDGGSSSRIIYRKNKRYRFLANDFAFRRIGLDQFLWDWKRHRKLASLVALKFKKS